MEQIEEKLQVDFTNITSWLEDNQLVINLKKGENGNDAIWNRKAAE